MAAPPIATRVVLPRELTEADIRAWIDLEARAIEPNVYMSPHFVLNALRLLDAEVPTQVWLVERHEGGSRQVIGVGVFRLRGATRACPLPHFEAYQSRHSYLSGFVLDRACASAALKAMLAHAQRHAPRRHAIVIPSIELGAQTADLLGRWARARKLAVHLLEERTRAVLVPLEAGADALRQALPKKKFNELERCRRKLATLGDVRWQCARDEIDAGNVDTFLSLEHASWKGEGGSSLRSKTADEAFFKAMTQGFAAEGRALFTALSVDGRVVASTANYVSGGVGFAFKVAWDSSLRALGVGIQNEAELVRNAPFMCSDLSSFDSGAEPGSFIDAMWPHRKTLATVVVPLGTVGDLGLRAAARLRQLKQRLRRRSKATDSLGEAAPA